MSPAQFREQIAQLTTQLAGRPLDAGLDAWLNAHPNGEIDLIMPLDDGAQFDGRPAGWLVCPPGSAHQPTVTHGRALVLYLLPQGSIEFTRH